MSNHSSYIDRCLEAIGSIDVTSLNELALGAEVGAGHEYVFKSLGRLGVFGAEMDLNAKVCLANSIMDPYIKFEMEVGQIEALARYAPEFASKAPQFMALLALSDGDPMAILTEDASRGGKVKPNPLRRLGFEPSSLALSIAKAFEGVEGVSVDMEQIDESLAFRVGGETRLLDFTPPIINLGFSSLGSEINRRVSNLVDNRDLVISVSPQSRLGIYLAAAAKRPPRRSLHA